MKAKVFFGILVSMVLASCEPRIDMDMKQWGDHAFIDNVEVIKLEVDDEAKLQEYYQNETPLTTSGVRQIVISSGKATIDSLNYTANVKLKAGEELNFAGLKIYHKGTLVQPINNSPKAGIVTDLTDREFTYRIFSADGSKHDWTIKIN